MAAANQITRTIVAIYLTPLVSQDEQQMLELGKNCSSLIFHPGVNGYPLNLTAMMLNVNI